MYTPSYSNFGSSIQERFGVGAQPKPKPKPTGVDSAFQAYDTSLKRQGDDYGDIMQGFKTALTDSGNLANIGSSAVNNLQYNAPAYRQSAEYGKAIGNLGELSKTGGYSPEDIAAIRERSVSPIRAIYANAQRNIERQRALQGGYSPNFTAASAKMARSMGGQVSDALVDAQAKIAQNVASNRLAASVPYASTTANEQNARNDFEQRNAENLNRFGLSKAEMQNQIASTPLQMRLSALQGMAGLYGTQPGLTTTTQRGAIETANLQNNAIQNNKNRTASLVRSFGSGG